MRLRPDLVRASTLTGDDALGGIADEWDELFRSCRHTTPFQTSAWLVSWWREYGQPGTLRLILARRAGVLVGALTLGKASPYLVNELGSSNWRQNIFFISLLAIAGGLIVLLFVGLFLISTGLDEFANPRRRRMV